MAAIQFVSIQGWEERPSPKAHTVYRIEIQANVRSWKMWRRYSEFDDLHTGLTKETGHPPPAPLPPKHKFSILRSHSDPALLEERKAALETYLRAILSSKEDKWRDTFAFREFLGIPMGKQSGTVGGAPTQFTSASWLDEHIELQTRIRDIRADINKRDALSDRGDVGGSHKANVSAKQRLAGVLSRIGTLGTGLAELGMGGMSEGELQRRTDMVARLQDDCEKLGKMVTVARQISRGLAAAGSSSAMNSAAPGSDREALIGGGNAWGAAKPVTRVFGAHAPPKETDQTRPLDNHGVFQLQKNQINEQDQQLSQLTTILHRQRFLGEAIGNELAVQNEMLDDLTDNVERVGTKLSSTNKQMNKLG